jgi:hypothetical protein
VFGSIASLFFEGFSLQVGSFLVELGRSAEVLGSNSGRKPFRNFPT